MLKTIEALTEQIRAYDRLIDELASRFPLRRYCARSLASVRSRR